ncbi:hypothetical protein ACLB1R_25220 [Escherichia coli]
MSPALVSRSVSLAIMGLIDYPGRVMAEKLEFNGQDLQRISEKERRSLVSVKKWR